MYHRNKIHTDEFWKYELAKHRRTGLDSKTNEEMWKKQIGGHEDAESEPPPAEDPQHEDKWLSQIQRATNNPENNAQVATEMKLLALQSLQVRIAFIAFIIINFKIVIYIDCKDPFKVAFLIAARSLLCFYIGLTLVRIN